MNGMDIAVRPVRTGNCGRGCDCNCQSGCEARCCELECLVRPNFFCGQMLTDADLTAMVEWTRQRLALARYRDGWGVVCGLDVSCGPPGAGSSCCDDTQTGPAVYLNPGYAIDCCGNDLVVCEPLRVDLSAMCRPAGDPCDPQPKPSTPTDPQDAGAQEGSKDCFEFSKGDLFAVQLNLRYHEDLTQGQRAMFRSGCSDVGSCEYTRVLERPCVHLEIVPIGDRDDKKEEEWLDAFRKRLKEELERIHTLLQQGPDAVVRYLRRHPPYQLCFIEEIVCCLREQQAADKSWAAGMLGVGVYLLLDWTLRELQCPCPSCRPDTGVPLSRVLLRRTEVRGRTVCKVVLIDSRIPYRRPLHKDPCRPIPMGELDLAPFLWQSREFAQSRLSRDVKFRGLKEFTEEKQIQEVMINQIMTFDPASGRELIAHIIIDPFKTERIAAFETRLP